MKSAWTRYLRCPERCRPGTRAIYALLMLVVVGFVFVLWMLVLVLLAFRFVFVLVAVGVLMRMTVLNVSVLVFMVMLVTMLVLVFHIVPTPSLAQLWLPSSMTPTRPRNGTSLPLEPTWERLRSRHSQSSSCSLLHRPKKARRTGRG